MEELKKDIEILLNHKIKPYPINNITESKNNKKDYFSNMPYGWNNKETEEDQKKKIIRFNKNEVKNALNNSCCGFYIKASTSDLLIIDVDNKKTTNPKLLSQLLKLCKFYIKTPNNGFHFYFKKTNSINKKYLGVFGNVDIIAGENVVFFGIREDGIYKIEKAEIIEEIPTEIKVELLEAIKDKELIKKISIDENSPETEYIKKDEYYITNKELLKLLNDLDKYYKNIYNDDIKEWFKISSILKKAGFKEVWDDWSKKSKKYNKKNNEEIFKRLKTGEEIPDLNYIIKLLNEASGTKNKNKYSLIYKIYKPYEPLNKSNLKKITKIINDKYLSSNIYNNWRDNIIKSSLGTAKTYSAFKFILENDEKIISICQLVNNVENHIRDFKNHPDNKTERILIKYDEATDYELQQHEDRRNGIIIDNKPEKISGLCSTIDSLAKVYEKYFIKGNNKIEDFVIYLDEIHSDLLHLLTSPTLNNKRCDTLNILFEILKRCKKLIMTDGNICDTTLNFYNSLNRSCNYDFIINEYKSFNNINVYNKSIEDIEIILNNLVIKNEFCVFACNTKTRVENTYITLKDLRNKYNKTFKILCYTSTEGEKIEDVNKEWENAFIIYSPSIISGLDFNIKTSQDVIIFIDKYETINAEQICQQVARTRNIRNVYICRNLNTSNTLKFNSLEELRTDYKNNVNNFYSCPIYKELSNKILVNHKFSYDENDFTNIYTLSQYHNNIMKSNIFYYIEQILISYGFTVHNRYFNDDNKIIMEKTPLLELEELEEYEKNNDENNNIINGDNSKYELLLDDLNNKKQPEDNKYNKQIINRLKILNLKIPDNNKKEDFENLSNILEKYEDIINNKYCFQNYIYFLHFIKNEGKLNIDFINLFKHEYEEHILKNKISHIKQLKAIIKKYLSNLNIYKFSYDERDEIYNDLINMNNDEYEFIKSFITTKKDPPKNKRELLRVINKCYKSILGDDIFLTERKQEREGKKKNNFNVIRFNDKYFNQFLELFKYSLNANENKRDIKNYDEYIIKSLDNINITLIKFDRSKEIKEKIEKYDKQEEKREFNKNMIYEYKELKNFEIEYYFNWVDYY